MEPNVQTSVPRVSVGLPVYNGEDFLEEALKSVLNQSYEDFELIISDNASTDGTRDICETYARTDPRIRYQRSETNRGASWNFNEVVRPARGEYFKWVAHDDICEPDFLLRCVEALDERPDVVLSYPGAMIIEEDEPERRPYTWNDRGLGCAPTPSQRLDELLNIHHSCFMVFGLVRLKAFRQTPLLGPFYAADVALLIRLAMMGPFYEIPEPLFIKRRHQQATVKMTDPVLYCAWFDPANRGRLVFPAWRQFSEYIRSVRESDIKGMERIRCYRSALEWPLHHGRAARMGQDLRMAARFIGRRLTRRKPVPEEETKGWENIL